jgi:hypothetical protein
MAKLQGISVERSIAGAALGIILLAACSPEGASSPPPPKPVASASKPAAKPAPAENSARLARIGAINDAHFVAQQQPASKPAANPCLIPS